MGNESVVSMDNQRVGLMMGISHKEGDLARAHTRMGNKN
jgi:hypothetical protein